MKALWYDKVNDRYELEPNMGRDQGEFLKIYALEDNASYKMREVYALKDGQVAFTYDSDKSEVINWQSEQYQKEYNVTDNDLIEATLPGDLFKELWDIVVHYEEV